MAKRRNTKSPNRKNKSRTNRRKSRGSNLFAALAIETLAVAAILTVFFGMRADFQKQNSQPAIFGEGVQSVAQFREHWANSPSPFSQANKWNRAN